MSQKQPRKLAEVQSEYAETIRGICLACGRPTANYYGMWQEGGTCCKKCEAVQEAKPKHEGHTEEDFFNRLNAQGEQHEFS